MLETKDGVVPHVEIAGYVIPDIIVDTIRRNLQAEAIIDRKSVV